MNNDLYWELDTGQLIDWLTIKDKPLERDGVRGTKIPDLPIEDIKEINQIIDQFRSKRPGTDDGGPVIYPSIRVDHLYGRSGFCWFLEKPLINFKGHYNEIELMIHKFEDDWYLVRYVDNPIGWNEKTYWYVCDEITGVIRLLKNLFN